MGVALFAVLMALFVFVCTPMQRAWGMAGLAATEALFLVLALAYALVMRIPFKEMFPAGKFTAKEFFGSLLLSSGGMVFVLISVAFVGMVYPDALKGSDVQALNNYIGGDAGYFVTMFVLAVMPAVCEEAIHRGAILSNFRAVRKEWVTILIMALFFGIFHMSVLRFIGTAIMGACLTYIVVRKNNMLLSSLMHFILNLASSTISYLSGRASGGTAASVALSASDAMRIALGRYLMAGIAAPFLIVLGLMLLNPPAHRKIRFLFAGIAALLMLAGSLFISLSSGADTVVQTSMSYTVEREDTESLPVVFGIENEGDYAVTVSLMNASGDYSVRLENDDGAVVTSGGIPSGGSRTYILQTGLEPGYYKIFIVNGSGTRGEKPVVAVQINRI